MGKKFLKYSVLLTIALALVSCVREDLVEPGLKDGEAVVELNFGFKDFERVKVETKATLDIIPESRISNMFVFIFVGEKRYYAHYFDKTSMSPNKADMREEPTEAWYVENRTEKVAQTSGTLRIHAPLCSGAEIYIIANIDSDMVNISPEKLNMISTLSGLRGLVATLNQEITSRNGLFPMTGTYVEKNSNGPSKVDITENGIYPAGKTDGNVSIDLERLDAKVMVNVRVATDYELTADENGVTTKQRLKEFRPESWQIVNLPKGTFLAAHSTEVPEECGYFSTEPVMFETNGITTVTYKTPDGEEKTVDSPVNGFSFYMLQNFKEKKHSVNGSFHERERRNKDAAGKYVTSGEIWTNAPENGTYMILKGEVVMQVDVSSEAKQQQLSADVTYYVHLGDIGSSLDDYDVCRNTLYTYNITVKGVNNIELEVTSSYNSDGTAASPDEVKENEPGAEGMVYVAKESIYTFDAHYGQRVFCFDAAFIEPDEMTWYVKTPFGREGVPDKIGDTEIPSGMDYQWVHFMINEISEDDLYSFSTDGGNTHSTANLGTNPYSHNNLKYPGDQDSRLMDVVEFVDYIKTQKRNKLKGLDNGFRTEFDQDWFDWYNNNTTNKISDPNTLVDGKPGPWFRDRIYVTVFVDEFYYDKDPVTQEIDPQLWKRFVNQPNRLMHLLCDNQKSLDGASSLTGSVVTIRQRSIQTPYNIDDPELVSAWGCETEDENADSYLWYFPGEKGNTYRDQRPANDDLGNTSNDNGLYNTAHIWGCVAKSGSLWNEVKWEDYLDYDRPNDYKPSGSEYSILFLKEDKACLKYSAMMRNRDNNGNGVIDMDEVRWYTASLGQLEYLFLGELGLEDEAKLYPRKYSGFGKDEKYPAGHPYEGISKWKLHVVSSTRFSDGYPAILWAEEGVSVSGYKQWEASAFSMKCVRNLGFNTASVEYFTNDDKNHRPQDLVIVTRPEGTITKSSVYKFDCSRISSKSKRFKTSIELEPYDETSEMARLYDGFETGDLFNCEAVGVSNYSGLRDLLQEGKSPCPDGYRVPNIREGVLIHLFATDSKAWWDADRSDDSRIFTSTYYSLGHFGNGKNNDSPGKFSWNIAGPGKFFGSDGNINLNGYKSRMVRCVRDWDPSAD